MVNKQKFVRVFFLDASTNLYLYEAALYGDEGLQEAAAQGFTSRLDSHGRGELAGYGTSTWQRVLEDLGVRYAKVYMPKSTYILAKPEDAAQARVLLAAEKE